MKFDDVRRIWREEDAGDFGRTRVEYLSAATDRVGKLDAEARRWFWLVTVLPIVLVPTATLLAIMQISRGYLVATLGIVLITISVVMLAIRWRRLRGAVPDPALPVSVAVEAQVARLLAWERYKNTVGWWFLGPFAVGYSLVMTSDKVDLAGNPVSFSGVRLSILVIVLSVFLAFVNRRDARLKVRPLREELESWIADLKDSDLEGVSDEELESWLADLRDSDLERAPDTY